MSIRSITAVLLLSSLLAGIPAGSLAAGSSALPAAISQTSGTNAPSLLDIFLVFLTERLGILPLPASGSTASPIAPSAGSSRELIGFYAEWWPDDTASLDSFTANADSIAAISPFWCVLSADGSLTGRGGRDHAAVVAAAHSRGTQVLLMLTNEKGSQDMSAPLHTLLSSPALRSTAIGNIEQYLATYRLDGINIDFEMVAAADRDNLSLFMEELYSRLKPQGYVISIDVFPKQDETNDVAIAYDYARLAGCTDKIIIMTYDNHGRWSSAGPIAPVDWVEGCLKYALRFIPPRQLYLGLAAYGYDWSSQGTDSLEYAAVMAKSVRFASSPLWDDTAQAPYFSYTANDGSLHQVWYENSRSLAAKLALIEKYNLKGGALWKLGDEDAAIWPRFKQFFRRH